MSETRWGVALRWSVAMLLCVTAGLVGTGLYLSRSYHPHVRGTAMDAAEVVHTVHRVLAEVSVALAVSVAAVLTGRLLPWDQLALRAVTVVGHIGGYGSILSGRARYVLRGSVEVTSAQISLVFWAHAVVVPLPLVGLLVALTATTRRARPRDAAADAAAADEPVVVHELS